MQHSHWRKDWRLSSVGDAFEAFLVSSGFDRGPWLAVAFGTGIAFWFALQTPLAWVIVIAAGLIAALGAVAVWRDVGDRAHLQMACVTMALLVVAGMAVVWCKSELVGAQPIARPFMATIDGRMLERIEQPADARVRLVLATRDAEDGRAIKVRVNLPQSMDIAALGEGALIRAKRA